MFLQYSQRKHIKWDNDHNICEKNKKLKTKKQTENRTNNKKIIN